MGNGTDFAQGWWQINVAFLAGGIFLILKRIIHWQIPVAMLVTFFCLATATAFTGFTHLSAISQLVSGAMMFGAFLLQQILSQPPLHHAEKLFWRISGVICLSHSLSRKLSRRRGIRHFIK